MKIGVQKKGLHQHNLLVELQFRIEPVLHLPRFIHVRNFPVIVFQ